MIERNVVQSVPLEKCYFYRGNRLPHTGNRLPTPGM